MTAGHTSSRLVVLKVGGNVGLTGGALGDLPALLRNGDGFGAVIVHGGGPAVSQWMARLQLPVSFRDGLRVTDEAALEVAIMVLRGSVNSALVAELVALGVEAVGLSGVDGGLVRAVPHPDALLGYVGQAGEVHPALLRMLIAQGAVPCIAPLAIDAEGQVRNINADTMCGALAGALSADLAVFLTDVPGVLRQDGSLAHHLRPVDVEAMIAEGHITGGMVPKVRACLDALAHGARAVCITDGRQRGALAAIAAGHQGYGTVIQNSDAATA